MLVAENELKQLKVKLRMTVLHTFFLPVYRAFACLPTLGARLWFKGKQNRRRITNIMDRNAVTAVFNSISSCLLEIDV